MLVANPRRNRFELYASCSPFSLFKEPFRASLHPAAGAPAAITSHCRPAPPAPLHARTSWQWLRPSQTNHC